VQIFSEIQSRWNSESCLVLFFFIVDHEIDYKEIDSHAENQNPSPKTSAWEIDVGRFLAQLKEIYSRSFFNHSTCV